MNNILLKTIGGNGHGEVTVHNDLDDDFGRPIKVQIGDDYAWLNPAEVRQLRKVLKPFVPKKLDTEGF